MDHAHHCKHEDGGDRADYERADAAQAARKEHKHRHEAFARSITSPRRPMLWSKAKECLGQGVMPFLTAQALPDEKLIFYSVLRLKGVARAIATRVRCRS